MSLSVWIRQTFARRPAGQSITEVPIDDIPDAVLDRIAREVSTESMRRVRPSRTVRQAAWRDMSRGWEHPDR